MWVSSLPGRQFVSELFVRQTGPATSACRIPLAPEPYRRGLDAAGTNGICKSLSEMVCQCGVYAVFFFFGNLYFSFGAYPMVEYAMSYLHVCCLFFGGCLRCIGQGPVPQSGRAVFYAVCRRRMLELSTERGNGRELEHVEAKWRRRHSRSSVFNGPSRGGKCSDSPASCPMVYSTLASSATTSRSHHDVFTAFTVCFTTLVFSNAGDLRSASRYPAQQWVRVLQTPGMNIRSFEHYSTR
jgi:hypothetical protein